MTSGNFLKIRSGGSISHALTTAWAQKVVLAGGAAGVTQRTMMSTFFRALARGGVLAKTDDMRWRAAESSQGASISLIRHDTVTPHNSPAFIKWRGVAYDGINQYDAGVFVPSTHASKATGPNLGMAVREQTNVADLKVAAGAYPITIIPRSSSGRIVGNLDSDNFQSEVITDSRALIGIQREGSVYSFHVDGVAFGTGAPTSDQPTLATVEMFFGCRNVSGTPGLFRLGIQAFWWFGAPLDAVEKLCLSEAVDAYLLSASALVDLNVYVSSVSYGGIPIGSDSQSGTIAAPLLTISRGLFGLPPLGTLHFNGNPAAAPTYAAASPLSLADAGTIEAINSRGAKLAGYGTDYVLTIAPTNGETINLDKAIIDASLNTLGAATTGIRLSPQTASYTVNLDDVQIQGFGEFGFAMDFVDDDLRVDLTLTDCDIDGGDVRGGIDLMMLKAGSSITIDGGTTTLAAQNLSGYGSLICHAQEAGVTASITDHVFDQTLQTIASGWLGSTAYVCILTNIVTVLDGLTGTLVGPDTGVLPNGFILGVSQGRLVDPYQVSIAGSRIMNCEATHDAYGGAILRLGDDDADRSLAADVEMGHCTGTGTANSASNGLHSAFIVNTLRPWGHHLTLNIGGIGLVDKGNWDGVFEDITVDRMVNQYILNKASLRSIYRRITCTAYAGYSGTMIHYSVGDGNNTGIKGDGTFTDCTFVVNGATNVLLINCAVGFGLSITGCHFELTSGSLAATKFVTPLGNFTTFAAFNAAYPGNTANFA